MASSKKSKITAIESSEMPEQTDDLFNSAPAKVLGISLDDELHITWGGILAQKSGIQIREFHFEGSFGLLLVNRGSLNVQVEGEPLVVDRGQVLVLRPDETCVGIGPNMTELQCQWITFHVDFAKSRKREVISVPRIAYVRNPGRLAELFTLVTEEYHEHQSFGKEGRMLSNKGAQFILLSILSRLNSTGGDEFSAPNALTVLAERTRDYIRNNFSTPITTADLAKAMDCSRGYLRTAFRETYGLHPTAFLIRARMYRSRELLATTRLPISQVARECGFSSLSYFTRVFIRNHGITPSQYRVTHSYLYVTPGI